MVLVQSGDSLYATCIKKWISIDKAQAGAQQGCGCIEQILALRLLIELCVCKKYKLYILFVDFQKAYDKVTRKKLIQCLKERGCGKTMLLALQALYKCTKMLFKGVTISTCKGVRQGAPTSCLLFVLYIDNLVKMLKQSLAEDGFLGMFNTLSLTDGQHSFVSNI